MALAQAAGKAAAKNVAKAVAKTATALVMVEPNPGLEMAKNLGKEIHIYKEIYTNQVVYSFYRVMRNKDAMKQLTFVGKQTVPRALRKDRWEPLAKVFLPTPELGQTTFRLLREFRKMHETQYDPALLKLPKVERAKILQDQKLNSIVDLSESLKIAVAQASEKDRAADVVIKWQDVRDAEYSKDWPKAVIHDHAKHPERYASAKEGPEISEKAKALALAKAREKSSGLNSAGAP